MQSKKYFKISHFKITKKDCQLNRIQVVNTSIEGRWQKYGKQKNPTKKPNKKSVIYLVILITINVENDVRWFDLLEAGLFVKWSLESLQSVVERWCLSVTGTLWDISDICQRRTRRCSEQIMAVLPTEFTTELALLLLLLRASWIVLVILNLIVGSNLWCGIVAFFFICFFYCFLKVLF